MLLLLENHGKWIAARLKQEDAKEQLRIRRVKENIPAVLTRITSEKIIINIIDGAKGYEFDHDGT